MTGFFHVARFSCPRFRTWPFTPCHQLRPWRVLSSVATCSCLLLRLYNEALTVMDRGLCIAPEPQEQVLEQRLEPVHQLALACTTPLCMVRKKRSKANSTLSQCARLLPERSGLQPPSHHAKVAGTGLLAGCPLPPPHAPGALAPPVRPAPCARRH